MSLALFSNNGTKLTSSLDGESKQEHLLIIDQDSHAITLQNVEEKPLASFLRNFSAPVKLEYPYSKADFANLMANDDDGL